MPKPKKLDDPAIRSKLLIAIAKGKTRTQACAEVGIDMRTLRLAERNDPELLEQIYDAEEAAFDPAEITVREMAKAGDLGAIKEYRSLKRRREVRESRERKIELETRTTHVIEIEDKVRELIGTLKKRRELDVVEMIRDDE